MTVIDLNLVISCKTRLNTVDLSDHTESITMTDCAIVFQLPGKPRWARPRAIETGENLQALRTKCLPCNFPTGTNYCLAWASRPSKSDPSHPFLSLGEGMAAEDNPPTPQQWHSQAAPKSGCSQIWLLWSHPSPHWGTGGSCHVAFHALFLGESNSSTPHLLQVWPQDQ